MAIHEAGHAITALALGERLVRISTEPRVGGDTTLLGHVELKDANYLPGGLPFTPQDGPRVERLIMILWAGEVAELHEPSGGIRDRVEVAFRALHDRKARSRQEALLLTTENYGLLIGDVLRQRLHRHVEDTGDAYWQRVMALARAVEGGKTLAWEEVVEVVADVERQHGLPPIRHAWLTSLTAERVPE